MGLIQITLFVLCEYYLAKRSTRPPLMRLGLWGRANGKFAAMQGIAFFEWWVDLFLFLNTRTYGIYLPCYFYVGAHSCRGWYGFNCIINSTRWGFVCEISERAFVYNIQGYTPVHTMLRLLPMSITGFILNAIVGLVVSRVDVLWLVGKYNVSSENKNHFLTNGAFVLATQSHRHASNKLWVLTFRRYKSFCTLLGFRFPRVHSRSMGCRFHICVRNVVRRARFTEGRTEPCRRCFSNRRSGM